MTKRTIVTRPDGDVNVVLTYTEWNARCDALRLQWEVDDNGAKPETDEITKPVNAKWSGCDWRDPDEIRYENGVWKALDEKSKNVVGYIQSLWDAFPREGDEAEFLEAVMLDRSLAETDGRPMTSKRMADTIARGLGIPDTRSHDLLSEWTDRDFWEYGVSARTGWINSWEKAWDRLCELRPGTLRAFIVPPPPMMVPSKSVILMNAMPTPGARPMLPLAIAEGMSPPQPMTFVGVYQAVKARFIGGVASRENCAAMRDALAAGWLRVAVDQGFDFDPNAVAVTVSKSTLRDAGGHVRVTIHPDDMVQFAARMTAEEREQFDALVRADNFGDYE